MHGHSTKKDVFMYGCSNLGNECKDFQNNIFIRLIPYIMSKKTPLFSYKNSKFRIEKNKVSTARVVNFSEFEILASYTLEASFYTCSSLLPENLHLGISHLESLGRDFCSSLLTFVNPRKFRKKLSELTSIISGKHVKFSHSEKPGEEVSIKDTIKEIDENLISGIDFDESNDSGGSDLEGSDIDEKKIRYKNSIKSENETCIKELRNRNKIRSVSPIENSAEGQVPLVPMTKSLKKQAPLTNSRNYEIRASSVIKNKNPKFFSDKAIKVNDDIGKIKILLNASPLKFTIGKIPNDSNLLTTTKILNNKKQLKRSKFIERKMRLQIINIIKNKLNNML